MESIQSGPFSDCAIKDPKDISVGFVVWISKTFENKTRRSTVRSFTYLVGIGTSRHRKSRSENIISSSVGINAAETCNYIWVSVAVQLRDVKKIKLEK